MFELFYYFGYEVVFDDLVVGCDVVFFFVVCCICFFVVEVGFVYVEGIEFECDSDFFYCVFDGGYCLWFVEVVEGGVWW